MQGYEERREFLRRIRKAKAVHKEDFISTLVKDKKVLDVGFLNHSVEGYERSPLHGRLEEAAFEVYGIDLNYTSKMKLANCFGGDITSDRLFLSALDYYFDFVVASELIEHLEYFSAFFSNCESLLKKEGRLVITTPNPFYIDNWLYSWLKADELVNPDHVCWIDPFNMKELLDGNNFVMEQFYWLKGGWDLVAFLTQRRGRWYDHRTAQWTGSKSLLEKLFTALMMWVWAVARHLLSMLSPLNRCSGYMVVVQKK